MQTTKSPNDGQSEIQSVFLTTRAQFTVPCADCRTTHDIIFTCEEAEDEIRYQAYLEQNPDYSAAERRAESGHAQ